MKKLDRHNDRRTLSTTVVVPCAPKHVTHLSGLLAALRAQTRVPDQIIFAVSGCEAADLPQLDAEVVHSTERQTAGTNRNRGSAIARGDIVIYQDADDLPHPQRVAIIAGLFEKYRIDHLLHFYYHLKAPDQTEAFSVKEAAKRASYHKTLPAASGVANGNPAITRSMLRDVSWPEYARIGEDLEFNANVYTQTKRTAVTELPLLTYRQNFSSFR